MHREAQISSPMDRRTSTNKKVTEQCPKCKSDETRKKGFRKTLMRSKQQRYFCKKCNYSFTKDLGFWKMKFNENKICQAIDTYYEGLSLRKVKRNFHKYTETDVSHQSILNWIHKYIFLIRQKVKTLQPQLSGHYLTDEAIIRCMGQNHNFGVVMDKHTRYVIATRYTENEYITPQDNIKLWTEAKRIQRPKKFTSDSHMTYDEAFNKVFYTRYKKDRVEWNKINCLKTGKFNYTMERLWNNLRERIKIMRGFKAVWSAKLLIDGYFIWHNFIRPHMTLKNTPATITGIKTNNWNELIYSSS